MKSTLTLVVAYTYFLCADGQVPNTPKTTTTTTTTTTSQPARSPITWLKCYNNASKSKNDDNFVKFCSAKDSYLSCLNEGLPSTSKLNGFDFALSLNFDFDISSRRLEALCSQYVDLKIEQNCTKSEDMKKCDSPYNNQIITIFNAYNSKQKKVQDLEKQMCRAVETRLKCFKSNLTDCSDKERDAFGQFVTIGFNDKCTSGGSLTRSVPGWFLLSVVLTLVWNNM